MHSLLNFNTLRMMLSGLPWQQTSYQWDRGNCILIGHLFKNCQRPDRQKGRSLDLQTVPDTRCSPATTIATCKQSGTRRLIYTAVIAGTQACLDQCWLRMSTQPSLQLQRHAPECCACSSVDVGGPSVDLLVACGPQYCHFYMRVHGHKQRSHRHFLSASEPYQFFEIVVGC